MKRLIIIFQKHCGGGDKKMSDYVKKRGEVISQDIRSTISKRYRTVTAAINRGFWNILNDTQNSLYVGSYGRGTAIDSSDLDILMILNIR